MYYVFVFFGVDPDKSPVHHPNPNHVESIVSDLEVWIPMDWSMLTPGQFLVCKKTTKIAKLKTVIIHATCEGTVWGIVVEKLLEEDEDGCGWGSVIILWDLRQRVPFFGNWFDSGAWTMNGQ